LDNWYVISITGDQNRDFVVSEESMAQHVFGSIVIMHPGS